MGEDAKKYLEEHDYDYTNLIQEINYLIDNSDDTQYGHGWNDGIMQSIEMIKEAKPIK